MLRVTASATVFTPSIFPLLLRAKLWLRGRGSRRLCTAWCVYFIWIERYQGSRLIDRQLMADLASGFSVIRLSL
jgi:hypothetical protein